MIVSNHFAKKQKKNAKRTHEKKFHPNKKNWKVNDEKHKEERLKQKKNAAKLIITKSTDKHHLNYFEA